MAATQRVRPAGREDISLESPKRAVPQDHQSILPMVAGVPAIGAVLIAVGITVLGVFIDSASGELTRIFAACYIAGCVLAAAAVRYRGLFTAAAQPPIILFISVPVAYKFLDSSGGSVKDLLISSGLPLVVRFPLMLVGTACVLALTGLRIYLARRSRRPAAERAARAPLATDAEPRARRRPRSARGSASDLWDDAGAQRSTRVADDAKRPAPRQAPVPQRPAPARRPAQRGPRDGAPGHPVPNVRYRDRPPLTER